MSPADINELAREALFCVLWLSLPLLGAALLAGLLSGMFQSFTRMSEPTIGHVSRIAAVLVVAAVAAPWMGEQISDFAVRAWSLIQIVGH